MLLAMLPPASWVDVLLLPGLACLFGLLAFVLGLRTQLQGGKPYWKYVGLLILILGAYAGFGPFYNVVGGSFEAIAYKDLLRGRGQKIMIAHWAGFWLPVSLILIGLLSEFVIRRRTDRSEF
ncbi:MAG: hypothetical protein QY327_00480 [Fimbriimonadaceae bacterium]|nr:MAG: hypothetical protein UZ18_ATM001001795 [Armatimonadetes bacterium OLB18]WKZ80375.1 MAG: hypothetical protein QY327_00480 [Fimbriimonadaceae bacterium]